MFSLCTCLISLLSFAVNYLSFCPLIGQTGQREHMSPFHVICSAVPQDLQIVHNVRGFLSFIFKICLLYFLLNIKNIDFNYINFKLEIFSKGQFLCSYCLLLFCLICQTGQRELISLFCIIYAMFYIKCRMIRNISTS